MGQKLSGYWWWQCEPCRTDVPTEEKERPVCRVCGEPMKSIGRALGTKR